MSKYNYTALLKDAKDFVATIIEDGPVALLCEKADADEICRKFDDDGSIRLLVLEQSAEKRTLKRTLNAHNCRLIIYSEAFESIVYEIFNDGTTLLSDSLLLSDYK